MAIPAAQFAITAAQFVIIAIDAQIATETKIATDSQIVTETIVKEVLNAVLNAASYAAVRFAATMMIVPVIAIGAANKFN
ncbi:MAG: hypothetical protein Q8873_04270 [Bacillota bacterium]|nr:hypothetical protein [Bacillota bacterium]